MRFFYAKDTGFIVDFVDDTTSPLQDSMSDWVAFASSKTAAGTELNISEIPDAVTLIPTRILDGQKVTSDYVAKLRTGTLEEKVSAIVDVILGKA
jgi:hypothetical protein